MATLDELIEEGVKEFRQQIDLLRSDLDTLKTRVDQHTNVLTRDSQNLTSLIFDPILNETITAVGPSVTTYSAVFDISQQSKDARGNQAIPHAFYLLSAYTPTDTRFVAYEGHPVALGALDINVYVNRLASTTPVRYESKIGVFNAGVTTTVNIRVLRLLGVK